MNIAGVRGSEVGTRECLEAGIAALGLNVPEDAQALMLRYLEELRRWARAYSLTAIRQPREMVTRHVLDSLAVLPWLFPDFSVPGSALRLLDVGSGAGLPAVPLALAAPRLSVTALDSNGKKARFLRHLQRTLPVANLEVIESRAEDYHPAPAFPAVISRAFAKLGEFLRLTAHLVAEDGRWLAMKGKVSPAELASRPPGMHIETIQPLHVPGLREARSLVIVRRLPEPRHS